MAVIMRCYHHSNCEDRPAVSFCSKCGKGLCRECADNLKSEATGKVLCADCLNQEMAADVNWAQQKKGEIKKEMIFIIVGLIIGIVVEIFLAIMSSTGVELWSMLFMLSFLLFFPTLLASFRTIIRTVGDVFSNFILRIIFFLILCVVSPIIFIWRLVKRAKDIKRMKRFAQLQTLKYNANRQYAQIAAQMTTRLTTEQFEQQMAVKYGALFKSNKEEAERQIAKEREKLAAQEQENARLTEELAASAITIANTNKELAETKAQLDDTSKKAQRNARLARKENRRTDYVGGDKDAA